jgi:predicted ester cyclase
MHTGFRKRFDMSGVDLVKQYLACVESGDIDKMGALVTDDFRFEGPVPEPLGKKDYISMMKSLTTAFPDWRFNGRDYKEDGNVVRYTNKVTGTQTGTLSLSMLPQPVAPSGKHIQLAEQHFEVYIKGDKISRIHGDNAPGSGLMGILDQLGVKVAIR